MCIHVGFLSAAESANYFLTQGFVTLAGWVGDSSRMAKQDPLGQKPGPVTFVGKLIEMDEGRGWKFGWNIMSNSGTGRGRSVCS